MTNEKTTPTPKLQGQATVYKNTAIPTLTHMMMLLTWVTFITELVIKLLQAKKSILMTPQFNFELHVFSCIITSNKHKMRQSVLLSQCCG